MPREPAAPSKGERAVPARPCLALRARGLISSARCNCVAEPPVSRRRRRSLRRVALYLRNLQQVETRRERDQRSRQRLTVSADTPRHLNAANHDRAGVRGEVRDQVAEIVDEHNCAVHLVADKRRSRRLQRHPLCCRFGQLGGIAAKTQMCRHRREDVAAVKRQAHLGTPVGSVRHPPHALNR